VVEEVRAYLDEVARRAQRVLGAELVGVYAGGSYALGGYEPGRSDIDVAVVIRTALRDAEANALVEELRHESLPSPARKLELVVYTGEAARSGSVEPEFELNLNSGPGELRVDRLPREGERPWFAVDRSVLAAHGIAVVGPPAREVFTPPDPAALRRVLADVLRWYLENDPESEAAVLNAGRALEFARAGVWLAKPAMRTWVSEQRGSSRQILERAIAELETG
jgi:predicted nucleotidyltransferase